MLIPVLLEFVFEGSNTNTPAWVSVMAWRQTLSSLVASQDVVNLSSLVAQHVVITTATDCYNNDILFFKWMCPTLSFLFWLFCDDDSY